MAAAGLQDKGSAEGTEGREQENRGGWEPFEAADNPPQYSPAEGSHTIHLIFGVAQTI